MLSKLRRFLRALSPSNTVRGRFSLVMGLTGVLFTLLLMGIMEWRWEASSKAATQENLDLTAQRIATTLIESLDNRQTEIHIVADMIRSSHIHDVHEIGKIFDRMRERQPDYAWIGFAGADGKVKAASGNMLQGVDVSQRPWFQNGSRGVFLGDPHQAVLLADILGAAANGEPHRFLDVAVPVLNAQNEPQGVIGAHLYWDWVQSVSAMALEDLEKKAPVDILIADQQGQWILKPRHETSNDLAGFDAAVDSGKYLTARANIIFKGPMKGHQWTVLVREETRYAFAEIYENRLLMAGVSLVVVLMISGAAWVLAGRVVQPIVRLVDVARAHSQGTAQALEPQHLSARDETGILGKAMHQMAFYDALTGLANRRLLREQLRHAQQQAARDHRQCALMLIDLDNFSLLNDTKGEAIGDQLLIEMAARLSKLAGANDTVARLGNDEFALLFTGLDSRSAHLTAQQKARELSAAIEHPFALDGETHHYTASVGICLFGHEETRPSDLLKHAEVAMLQAKQSAHSKTSFYTYEMQAVLDERALLERSLRQAIPGQLKILYQPQLTAQGDIVGAELLVRWMHPTMGMVSPARFIPVAEATGMIIPIGQWVLEQACDRLRSWQDDRRLNRLVLAVNVSAKEFVQADFVERVTKTVRQSGADATKLKLELTESILANDISEVVSRMNELKTLGISFALDDFGTGFSSLAYLKEMPLDQLKIDQSFVREVAHNEKDAAIVNTVIALGHSMNLDVIAEGVETREQREVLRAAGCLAYQGYLFARPMSAEELETWRCDSVAERQG